MLYIIDPSSEAPIKSRNTGGGQLAKFPSVQSRFIHSRQAGRGLEARTDPTSKVLPLSGI
jgi:hypothetical protein